MRRVLAAIQARANAIIDAAVLAYVSEHLDAQQRETLRRIMR